MRLWIPVLSVILVAATGTAADTDGAPVEAKPVRVSLFKNGYGMVTSRVEVTRSGRYIVKPLPEASLGTFWLRWPAGVEVTRAVTAAAGTRKRVQATSLSQMLEANLGRMVQVEASGGTEPIRIRGRLVDYPLIPETETGERGEVILIETEGSTAVIPAHSILRLFIEGESPASESEIVETDPALTIDVETASGETAIEIDALAQGIAWAPSYSVDITADGKDATFSAKAVIVNDLADLENVSTELIAGFPHLQFASVPSALSLEPLHQLLQGLRRGAPPAPSGVMSNVMVQSAAFEPADVALPSMPATPVMGEQSEDLYFYSIENVTLAKGERGYYPLFRDRVPYEHVYTWTIPAVIMAESFRRPDMPDDQNEIVWHVLRLTNTTERPWTTAPASTTKGGRLLGQDTLNYTPPGQKTDLRITRALDIEAESNEYETERQREAARFYGQRYDLVTFRGELEAVNHTGRSITLEITKQITGEVQQTEGDPRIAKIASNLGGVNPTTRLIWTIDVEPGDDKGVTLAYTFQAYVRN